MRVELTLPDNERPTMDCDRSGGRKYLAVQVRCLGLALVLVAALSCACVPIHSDQVSASTVSTRDPQNTVFQDAAVTYGLDVNPAIPTIGLPRVPQVLQLVQSSGASAVRTGGNWATEEPSPEHYNFSEVDQLFSLAKADRLTVLFELGKEPSGTRSEGTSTHRHQTAILRLRAAPP